MLLLTTIRNYKILIFMSDSQQLTTIRLGVFLPPVGNPSLLRFLDVGCLLVPPGSVVTGI